MRTTIGIGARLALAALFVTFGAGFAGASDPVTFSFDVAGDRADDRPPTATQEKIAAPLHTPLPAVSPRLVSSNQYPPEIEPNNSAATATPITGTAAQREGNIFSISQRPVSISHQRQGPEVSGPVADAGEGCAKRAYCAPRP